MKFLLSLVAWTFVAGAIVFTAVNPNGGVAFQGGGATLGLGLIGLGLCLEARKKLLKPAAAKQKA